MTTRVAMTVIIESEATDEGKFLVRGNSRRGKLEVEIPGEAANMLISALIASLPKLSKRSGSGTRPSFQMAAFELRETNDPETVNLYLQCAAPTSRPDAETVEVAFSMSWDQLADMGPKLADAANKRPPRHPQTIN